MDADSSKSIAEADSKQADSSVNVSDSSTEVMCESCFEAIQMDRLFKCVTCIDLWEGESAVKFNCEGCIMPHLKKGHTILDHKSLKPAVCETHKNLYSVFCSKCEQILCLNCLPNHPNHNIMALKERGSQVRSKVSELIADLGSCETLVRVTKERLNEDKETRSKGYEKLVRDVSAELDALKQKLLDHISEEHENIVNLEHESNENYESLLEYQSDLRELLCCSDRNIVEKMKEKEKQVNHVKTKAAELKLCQIKGVNYSISEKTAQLVNNFSENFLRNIEIPRMDITNKVDECYVYSKIHGTLYSVECEGNEIIVYECKFEEHREGVRMSKMKLATHENEYRINELQAFLLMGCQSCAAILIKNDNASHLFQIASKSFRSIKLNLEPKPYSIIFCSHQRGYC